MIFPVIGLEMKAGCTTVEKEEVFIQLKLSVTSHDVQFLLLLIKLGKICEVCVKMTGTGSNIYAKQYLVNYRLVSTEN